MISANEARKKAELNNIEITRRDIEQAILKAVSNGKDKIVYTGPIPKVLVMELESNGYIISNNMIKW